LGGAIGEIWEIIGSVKTVSVCVSFENNETKVLVAFKCCESFEYIAIFDLR
jgi:hypothetical protein